MVEDLGTASATKLSHCDLRRVIYLRLAPGDEDIFLQNHSRYWMAGKALKSVDGNMSMMGLAWCLTSLKVAHGTTGAPEACWQVLQ